MKRNWQNPLIISASEKGDRETVANCLREHPESVNEASTLGTTALHAAASQNKKDICDLLLKKGANVEARCKQGKTPLHFAAAAGGVDVARILIDHGADLAARDNRGQTPLEVAIGHEELGRPETTEIIRLLTLKDQDAMQNLKTAIAEGKSGLVRSLLEANQDLIARSDDPGDLLLQAVIHYEEAGTTDIIKLLLEKGVHPNTKSKAWPELPILYATQPEVAELLLAAGANPNVSNREGMTPLRKARKYKLKELEDILLRYGATTSVDKEKAAKTKGKSTTKQPDENAQETRTTRKKKPKTD